MRTRQSGSHGWSQSVLCMNRRTSCIGVLRLMTVNYKGDNRKLSNIMGYSTRRQQTTEVVTLSMSSHRSSSRRWTRRWTSASQHRQHRFHTFQHLRRNGFVNGNRLHLRAGRGTISIHARRMDGRIATAYSVQDGAIRFDHAYGTVFR